MKTKKSLNMVKGISTKCVNVNIYIEIALVPFSLGLFSTSVCNITNFLHEFSVALSLLG